MKGGRLVKNFPKNEYHLYEEAIKLYGNKNLSIHPARNEYFQITKNYYSLRILGYWSTEDETKFFNILEGLKIL